MHRRITQGVAAACLLALAWAPASLAQGSDEALKREIEALKQGQAEIRKQLEEIKQLVQQQRQPARPAAPDVKDKVIDLGENAVQGAQTAQLTLIEFTDYQ